MYGWFLTIFRDYLQIHYPEKSWEEYCYRCAVTMNVIPLGGQCPVVHRHDNIPDHHALHLFRMIIEDMTPLVDSTHFLEEIGALYLQTLINQGYDSLLRCLGSSFEEWLSNINKVHAHLDTIFPNIAPPEFWCEPIPPSHILDFRSIDHHYFFFYYQSQRPQAIDLFIPFLCGLVRAVAKEYFSLQILSMDLQGTQGANNFLHTYWKVTTVPLQDKEPKISSRKYQNRTPRSGRCPFRDDSDSQLSGNSRLSSPRHFFPSRSLSSEAAPRVLNESPVGSASHSELMEIQERFVSASEILDLLPGQENGYINLASNSSLTSSHFGSRSLGELGNLKEVRESQHEASTDLVKSTPKPDSPPKTKFFPGGLRTLCFRRPRPKLVPVTPRSSGCEIESHRPHNSILSFGSKLFKPSASAEIVSSSESFSTPFEQIFQSLGITTDMATNLYPFHILFETTSLSIISSGLLVSEYVELTNPSFENSWTMEDIFFVREPKNLDWAQVQRTLDIQKQSPRSRASLVLTVVSKKPSLRCPRDSTPRGFRLKGQVISSRSHATSAALFLASPDVISISDMLSQGLTLFDLEKFPLAQSLVIQSEIIKLETQVSFKKEKEAEVRINATHTLANELKTVAHKAEEALDVKKIFVRTVSHEIRTPLTVAKMGLSLLDKDFAAYSALPKNSLEPLSRISSQGSVPSGVNSPATTDDIKEIIQEIQLSIDTAIDILNDLLAYEKLESGILVTYKSLQPVHQFIMEGIRPFRLQANEKSITLTVENCNENCFSESGGSLEAQDMLIYIDEKKMAQVIRNLLSNAIKFTPVSGSVKVKIKFSTEITPTSSDSTDHPGGTYSDDDVVGKVVEIENTTMILQRRGTLTLEFVDTGVGLTEENQRKLFKEIIQFSPDKLQNGGGSGLGLWITSRIIALHGGVVGVWSAGPGCGSSFYFSIPLYAYAKHRRVASVQRLYTITSESTDEYGDRDGNPSVRSQLPPSPLATPIMPPPSPLSSLQILVVDDAPSIRKIIQKTLKSIGCICDSASDGHMAIKKIQQSLEDGPAFDLILMDNIMSPMNGLDATREILKLGYRGLIFGATGNVMPDDIQQFLDAGAHEVLAKPLSLTDLEAAYCQHTGTRTRTKSLNIRSSSSQGL